MATRKHSAEPSIDVTLIYAYFFLTECRRGRSDFQMAVDSPVILRQLAGVVLRNEGRFALV